MHSVLSAFCSDWPFDQDLPARPAGFLRKVKGHKHDKLAAVRYVAQPYCFQIYTGLSKQQLPDIFTSVLTGRKKFRRTWMACLKGYKSTGCAANMLQFCDNLFAVAVPSCQEALDQILLTCRTLAS